MLQTVESVTVGKILMATNTGSQLRANELQPLVMVIPRVQQLSPSEVCKAWICKTATACTCFILLDHRFEPASDALEMPLHGLVPKVDLPGALMKQERHKGAHVT